MKRAIIILIILLLILCVALLAIIHKNQNSNSELSEELKTQEESYINGINNPGLIIEGTIPKKVTQNNIFFITEDCVKKYIQYTLENNTKAIYSLLDYKYINEKSITIENVSEYTKRYTNSGINKTIEMYEVPGIEYYTYYAKHRLGTNTIYFIVNTDISSNSFSIVPIESAEYEQKIVETVKASGDQEDTIEKNEYNTISYKYYQEEDIVDKYLQDYLNNAIFYPEEAYATLDEEYKEKKFGSLEEYKKYIAKNKSMLETMCKSLRKQAEEFDDYRKYEEYYREISKNGLSKYQINNKNDNKQYILIDSYENYYIFNTSGIMNYSLILDTYTIDLPEFVEKYNEASEEEKVMYNIQKVFDAINSKDYKYVYNKLDNTFKLNYFKTQEEFEKYIKENWYTNNDISYGNYQKNGEVYVYNIKITDGEDKKTEKIDKRIVMQLKEGTDFVMSFNVE